MELMNDDIPQALIDTEVVGSAAIKENWTTKLDFALPKRLPSLSFYNASGHSPEYYET